VGVASASVHAYDGTGADLQSSAVRAEKKRSNPVTVNAQEQKKKKDPNRFKAISDRANAKLTDEQKAAIEKNNNRIYWKNKERMNNSGSYKAMMQSRTKGEMQRAAKNNAKTPLSGESDLYKSQQRKKTEDARRRAMEKAFGRKKGR
jgi:hypothetical protein